jgi:hypothetical protein
MSKRVRGMVVVAAMMVMGCAAGLAQTQAPKNDAFDPVKESYSLTFEYLNQVDGYLRRMPAAHFNAGARDCVVNAMRELSRAGITGDTFFKVDPDRRNYYMRTEENLAAAALELAAAKELPGHAGMRGRVVEDLRMAEVLLIGGHGMTQPG